MSSPPILQVCGLRIEHRRPRGEPVRAVDGVDLTVGRGEIVVLIGESGCGKTTLARALVGLERPVAGRVLLEGVELGYRRHELKAWRRRVHLIPQDPVGSLNPARTVYQAIAEGPRIHRNRADQRSLVAAAVDRCGLRPPEGFFGRYPGELSGGQVQRVLIAGALALGPDLLIADELVTGLDASVRGLILALLLELRDTLGLSALVVTHDLGVAWSIADRLAVMRFGRLVEVGPAEQVLADPRHPHTQALLSALPRT